MASQIEAEKAKLPLTFLFERNLDRTYCKQQSVTVITQIFSKLQHRFLFASFHRWLKLVEGAQLEERRQAALHRSQAQALALFQRLASDAYVGTLDKAFRRWLYVCEEIKISELNTAATQIQSIFRQRRSRALLASLKQASLDREFKARVEIQQLLAFEAYGTAMQWSTLRNGFNLLLQNHCARRIQFFFRRLRVQRHIACRLARKAAATRIQTIWRGRLAKKRVESRRVEVAERIALERRSAIEIQRHARGYLAKCRVRKLRDWQSNENQMTLSIQHCWRKYLGRIELHRRFALRKQAMDEERARLAQKEYERLQAEMERQRQSAAINIERVARGFFGRQIYRQLIYEKQLEYAARRVQTSWRKSKGRYALHIRFLAQRERLAASRDHAARCIQGCFRIHRARVYTNLLRQERHRREMAATRIQRIWRGFHARHGFQRKRRATIKIQYGWKCKAARMERQRRFDTRAKELERRRATAIRLQQWLRMVVARICAQRLRDEQQRRETIRRHSALVIQKRARAIEARRTVQVLREAKSLIEQQQSRRYRDSSHSSSALQDGMTWYYLQRAAPVDTPSTTVNDQLDMLQLLIEDSKTELMREDEAIVLLQRHYRGYVSRVAFWAKKVRDQLRRALELKMAMRIQPVARGFIARKRVKQLRQKRKLEEWKEAYIRERKWKEEESTWKEEYHREQTEIQIRKIKAMELKMKEAKRDAELAKWQAEAAMYRKQQLLSKQAFPKNEGGEKASDDEIFAWETVSDGYGNVYYYNSSTGKSSWDLPVQPPGFPDSSSEKPKPETPRDEESKKKIEASIVEIDLPGVPESGPSSVDPVAEVTKVRRKGICDKCMDRAAVKECMDCHDPDERMYCASCFALEHHAVLGPNAKQNHDFKVLIKVKNPSGCQSLDCLLADRIEPPNLATYFCGECPNGERFASLNSAEASLHEGCFYCDQCFLKAHETAQESHHLVKALHFRTGALLCCDCNGRLASRQCEECDEQFCAACFEIVHAHSVNKYDHLWSPIDIVKDELPNEKDVYCIDCDRRRATKLCNLCGDGFCDVCFETGHEKGKKQHHTWIPWESFVQVNDWLEIWDDKTNAQLYFNLETKESTTKKPFAMKSGVERHQLQFEEREQMQKRKQLELESELIKLKEQIKEFQDKETQSQRPMSRSLRSGGGAVNPRSEIAVDSQEQEATLPNSTKKATDAKKKSAISRFFSRSKKPPPRPDDGLAPEERKRKDLVSSIQDEEYELMMAKLKTRTREEKENKAKQTFGTKQFEQAIIQELAQAK